MNIRKNRKKLSKVSGGLGGLLVLFILVGCSSAPRRPAEVFTTRNTAETRLDLVNREVDRGNYTEALDMLTEVRRLAVSVDDPSLLIRESLSRANILYALGYTADANEILEGALAEALVAGERELASAVRIHQARSNLFANPSSAGAVVQSVNREISSMRNERLHIAFGWTVIALAYKEQNRWTDAENAMRRSLQIHERNNNLEQAAYSWFLIGAIRSNAGQYQSAVEALRRALEFDRRAENTFGLGADWRAIGDVYRKMGNHNDAHAAYNRALEIFESADIQDGVQSIEARLARGW